MIYPPIFWPYGRKCNKILVWHGRNLPGSLLGDITIESSKSQSLNIHSRIQENVARLYNQFPYPNYPLLARPRWQDGFLASSYFSRRLASQGCGTCHAAGDVLVAGCGEILPYVIRKWEDPQVSVVNIDLSHRSLARARLRTLMSRGKSEFHEMDIVAFLDSCHTKGRKFAHIETFGMLHHMADPATAVAGMVRQLAPGGTIRLMVYNSPARQWIHALQDYFAGIGLGILNDAPVQATRRARDVLSDFAARSPFLADRLRAVGTSTLNNPARMADTFLHPHELRWPIGRWLEIFASAGLKLLGIFDRYGELDDLVNPLWLESSTLKIETISSALADRAADRRFEGNLELIWVQDGQEEPRANQDKTVNNNQHGDHLKRLKFCMPPHIWFDFEETRHLSTLCRLRIWHAFLAEGLDARKIAASAWGNDPRTLQRLARLGAIFPDQLDSAHAKIAAAPMTEFMTPPDFPDHAPLAQDGDAEPHASAIRTLDEALNKAIE